MTQPVPLPLIPPIGARYESLTVDSKLVNGFVERNSLTEEFHVYKRPGFKLRSSTLPSGTPLGLTRWGSSIYAVIGNTVYKDGVALTGTVDTAGGHYTFAAGLGATPKLFLHNRTNGYSIDGAGTLTAITDTNFPPNRTPSEPLIPGAVYLNGTFYVMSEKSEFANSDSNNNDPETWEAAVLGAEFEGTEAVVLAKNLIYAVVLKDFFAEVFYDAGNPAPGSPLGPVGGAKMNFGTVAARSLADAGGELLFAAQTTEGTVSIVKITALSASVVSTPQVERILSAANFSTVYSWAAKSEGHRFYGLTLPASNLTLVFDLTSNLWYQWADTNGNYLPYAFATIDTNGRAVFIHESNGRTFNLDGLTFADDGSLYTCDIYTPNFAQDLRTKIVGRLDLVADRVPGSSVTLRWSDDDYVNWSAPQTIDLSLERPGLADMGSFYRRAFHFSHRANTPFRLERAVIYAAAGA